MEASPWDLHHVEGVGIEDVESVAAIHEHLRESHIAHNRADDEREPARARHMVGMVTLVKGNSHLGPS
jgi:hypothetical protein